MHKLRKYILLCHDGRTSVYFLFREKLKRTIQFENELG